MVESKVLMAATQSKNKMKSRTAFEVVFCSCFVVDHLLAAKDQPLLNRRNAFFFFHLLFDLGHFVVALDVELYFLARKGSDFDQHFTRWRPKGGLKGPRI